MHSHTIRTRQRHAGGRRSGCGTRQVAVFGFYSYANPLVDPPRWSQATERRIGEGRFAKRHQTLVCNRHEQQAGQLYAGMDLRKNF